MFNFINTPFFLTRIQIKRFFDIIRYPFRMFDYPSVHIDQVHRTIGAYCEIHRSEIPVSRSQEILSFQYPRS